MRRCNGKSEKTYDVAVLWSFNLDVKGRTNYYNRSVIILLYTPFCAKACRRPHFPSMLDSLSLLKYCYLLHQCIVWTILPFITVMGLVREDSVTV